jgi:hypothetical protein
MPTVFIDSMSVELPYVGEAITKALIENLTVAFLRHAKLPPDGNEEVKNVHHAVQFARLDRAIFDGASTIDLLLETSERWIPIEVKLGTSRLQPNEFARRFLRDCDVSQHNPPRWNGNTIAFLERRFAEGVRREELSAKLGNDIKKLSRDWILVVRTVKIADDLRSNRQRIGLSNHAYIIALETLVNAVGTSEEFNAIVGNLLTFDYYGRWFAQGAPPAEPE